MVAAYQVQPQQKLKATSEFSRLLPLENAYHPDLIEERLKHTIHLLKLSISWLSCNEDNDVKLIKLN